MPRGGASETGPNRQNGLASPIRRTTHLAATDYKETFLFALPCFARKLHHEAPRGPKWPQEGPRGPMKP